MNRQHTFILFIVFFIGFFINFCSNPVKVGEDSNKITITNARIDDVVDIDGDGYASSANLYFDISATKATMLYAKVGYRYNSSEDPTYYEYKTTVAFSVDGQVTKFIALGDDGYEIPSGCYDLTIHIFDQNDSEASTILASISADETDNLLGIYMEEPSDDAFQLKLNNTTFTKMDITAGSYGTQTVNSGESAYFYVAATGNINVTASTSGQTSSGTQIGTLLHWNFNINITQDYETNIVVSNTYFFLRIRNNGPVDFAPIYVNYGLTDQTMDNILIPHDNVNYNTGYYKAYSNTEVRAYYNDASGTYIYWYPASLYSGENNQLVELWWDGGGLAKQGITDNWSMNEKPELINKPELEIKIQNNKEYKNPVYNIDK